MINRDDMLELTRRMTNSRTHLQRVAGAYMDEEGFIDGTFNTAFPKLKGAEKRRTLEIAKAIPFSRTNEELIQYQVPSLKPGSVWQLLYALRDCEIKNDALLLNLYEYLGEGMPLGFPYSLYVYYGCYDIPRKASDGAVLEDSEEIYRYLIIAVSPVDEEQVPGKPVTGFLYPALTDRSLDITHVNLYTAEGRETEGNMLKKRLFPDS